MPDTPKPGSLSVADFAAKIRAKYPGQYDDRDDVTLARAYVNKFPVYSQYLDKEGQSVVSAPNTLAQAGLEARRPLSPEVLSEASDVGAIPVGSPGYPTHLPQPEAVNPDVARARNVQATGEAIESAPAVAAGAASMLGGPEMMALSTPARAALTGAAAGTTKAATGGSPAESGGYALLGAGGEFGAAGLGKLFSMIPTRSLESAGGLFDEVKAAAGKTPLDLSKVGDAALDASDLQASGGRLPKVIGDFLKRTTRPDSPPLTYAEARNFYSNATRLSQSEAANMSGPMKAAVSRFTKELGDSIGDAADAAGQAEKYQDAMASYRTAKQFNQGVDNAKEAVGEALWDLLKFAVGAGGGSYIGVKLARKAF